MRFRPLFVVPAITSLVLFHAQLCPGATIYSATTSTIHSIVAIDPDLHTETTVFSGETVVAVAPGPTPGTLFYIAPGAGPNLDELYLHVIGGNSTLVSDRVYMRMLGEGRDGYWYFTPYPTVMGLSRVDPVGTANFIGDGAYPYMGDVATSCDGTMYGTTARIIDGIPYNDLVTVNKNTGEQTIVGTMSNTFSFHALAYTDDGRLWASGTERVLYQVDPSTGALQFVMNLTLPAGDLASESSLPFNCGPTRVRGLSFGELKVRYR